MTALIEAHPYNSSELIPKGTCLLIIGTAPPPRFSELPPKPFLSGDIDFFYGSKDNQLWSMILPKLYEREFLLPSPDDSLKACRDFLSSHKIWMVDVLQSYKRTKPQSAKDSDLDPITYTEFRPIFEQHTTIDTLVLTGGRAEEWTGNKLENERLIGPGDFWRNGKSVMPRLRKLDFGIDGTRREIQVFTLPSPSRASDRRYKNSKLNWYGEVLLRRCPRI